MKLGFWISILVVVGALALVGLQQGQISKLQRRIAELETQPATVADPATTRRSRQLPGRSADLRVASGNAKRGDRSDGERGTDDLDGEAELGQSLRKMVENPAGQAMMNQGIKAMTSMWFRDLIEDFDLNKNESDYFLQLVAGPMSVQQQVGMKMMNAESPEERMKLAEEIQTATKEAKEAIKEFLNDEEDFATYEEFEKRLPERQQLDGLRAVMANAEAPLTPEQEDQVIEAMYRARTSENSAPGGQGLEGRESPIGQISVEKFEKEWERSSQVAAKEVGKVLQGSQLEAFLSYQSQMKDMQLMGLKMAEKMFKTEDSDSRE